MQTGGKCSLKLSKKLGTADTVFGCLIDLVILPSICINVTLPINYFSSWVNLPALGDMKCWRFDVLNAEAHLSEIARSIDAGN